MIIHGITFYSFMLALLSGILLFADGSAQSISRDQKPYLSELPIHVNGDTVAGSREEILVGLLDNSLHSLAESDRRGLNTGGYVLLGLGIGSAVGGVVTLIAAENDDARIVGYSLIGGGALMSGLSLVPFKIKSESELIYAKFRDEMLENPEPNLQRVYYWDRRFEEFAQKRKRGRIIGGLTSIAAGAVTGFVLVEGSSREQLHTFLWPAIGGVTSLIVKSETERRYETYRRAKEDVLGGTSFSEIRIGILPLPDYGLVSTVRVRF